MLCRRLTFDPPPPLPSSLAARVCLARMAFGDRTLTEDQLPLEDAEAVWAALQASLEDYIDEAKISAGAASPGGRLVPLLLEGRPQ
jgi:hypothetical protein